MDLYGSHGSIENTPYPRGVSRREGSVFNPRYSAGHRSAHTAPGIQFRYEQGHPFYNAVTTNHLPEKGSDMRVTAYGMGYGSLVEARRNTSEAYPLALGYPEFTRTLNGGFLSEKYGQRPVTGILGKHGRAPSAYERVRPGG